MKKLVAILMTLCLLCAAAACAENQLPEPFTLRNGIRFGMNLSEVTALEKVRYHDLDVEDTSGPASFTELEYEQMRENDVPCEIKYLFVDDGLVAVKFNYETRFISYARLKDELTALYGEAAVLDVPALGNAVYAIDDDGRPERQAESWTVGDTLIVLELDEDDIDVTYLDLAAPYLR